MIAPTHELTTKEAAALKGVTTAAISRAIREGRLPARIESQPGRARATWRIQRSDVEDWNPASAKSVVERAAAGDPEANAAYRKLVEESTGILAGGLWTLEDFLREKREDLALEEYHPVRRGD